MTPMRLILVVIIAVAAGLLVFLTRGNGPEITLSNAELSPMGAGQALVITIDNPGPPDRITGVAVEGAGRVMLTSVDDLIIPGGDQAQLAMDGIHAMVMGLGDAGEGLLVPVTVTFEDGGPVSTRARVSAVMEMDHSALYEVPDTEPKPSVSLTVSPSETGFLIMLETENITFSQDAVDQPHQPGVGHAHLYLNGLKLGRVYSTTAEIGTLPPGNHVISVSLNTNDHQAYAVDGTPVHASVTLTVD